MLLFTNAITLHNFKKGTHFDRSKNKLYQHGDAKKWIIQKMIQPYLFMDELEQIDINIKNKIIGWALKQGKQIDFGSLSVGSYVIQIESEKYIDALKFIKAN